MSDFGLSIILLKTRLLEVVFHYITENKWSCETWISPA
jgi:hypothetical protein